jgi:hypothetical protein
VTMIFYTYPSAEAVAAALARPMTIVTAWPPNIEAIARYFPGARRLSVVFAWGDKLFAPGGEFDRPEILAHERVHGARQGETIEAWWDRYIYDPQFRLVEELAAHAAELRVLQATGIRQARRRSLDDVAEKLAAPLYHWPSLTFTQARAMLSTELRRPEAAP